MIQACSIVRVHHLLTPLIGTNIRLIILAFFFQKPFFQGTGYGNRRMAEGRIDGNSRVLNDEVLQEGKPVPKSSNEN